MGAKQKIIDEASKLIHRKGFNNTSVQDMLDAASVTKSNFYYHFDSKEKLGFDMLKQHARQFHDFAIEPSLGNPALAPSERVDKFLDRVLRIASLPEGELGCPFGNMAQEMSSIHEPLRLFLSEFFEGVAARLASCFEEGKRAGEFSESLASAQLAEFVLAQIQGAFLLRKTHRDFGVMERNMEVLRGVIKENRR